MLIDKVARGGNLLLNIGPTADGRIPVIMQQRLMDIGKWLKINGAGIYGTRAWDKAPAIAKETSVYYSRKGNDLFAMVTGFKNNQVVVKGIKKPGQVKLLGYDGPVKYNYSGDRLTITLPAPVAGSALSQDAWVFQLAGTL